MSAPVLRPARSTDAAGIEGVLRAAYGPWLDRLEGLPDVAGGIAEEIARHHVWVAACPPDEAVVGVVVMHVTDGAARIANLAVHPDCGGKGIGRGLMSRAEAEARAGGHRRLVLTTHREMTPTLQFYRRDGWVETGREGFRVFMAKTLS